MAVERPVFPWNDAVTLTTLKDRGLLMALSAIFELLVQMADTLDAIERDQ